MRYYSLFFVIGLVFVSTIFIIWQVNSKYSNLERPIPESSKEYNHVPKRREQTEISYDVNSLPSWDFTRLINMDKFTFLLENTVCNANEPVDMLIVIHTAPKNVEKRNAIRDTWGQKREGIKLVFLLGGVDNQKLQDELDAEERKYLDIVQGNFVDSYKNMTYKHIMAFKYTVYYCPSAKYVLKTDDDILINMPLVLNYVRHLPKEKMKNLILCSTMDGSPAIREPSKWNVPFSEFPHSFYPIYCSGFAVIYSYDVVFRLYREAQRGEYFWVDDAFVSGVLAKRLNIKHTSFPPKVLMTFKEMDQFVATNGLGSSNSFWVGPVNINHEAIRKLWAALVKSTTSKNQTTS